MDDINFDELDKAVNSALQQTAPKNTPSADPVVVADESLVPAPAPEKEPATPAQPVVVPKRRGQFMDMVHPSSDMIKSSAPRPNRQAATIEPLNPSIVEGPKESPVEETPVDQLPEALTTDTTEPVQAEPVQQPEWPDPLDVMEQTEQEKSEETTDQPSDENGNEPTNEFPATTPEEPTDPVVSPFLSGTSPEKRPLGAFTGTPDPGEELADTDDEVARDEVSDETMPVDSRPTEDMAGEPLPVVPVPQELAPEVVSVEADEPSRVPEPAQEGSNPAEGAVMTTSIPQQYKNGEVPPEDQADHPVFDTRDYHQPLTPPAKKGHTGVIVTIVLLLLALLGVGAWYAVAVLKLI